MERGWIETIQLLGLDVVAITTLALLTLDRLAQTARALLNRRVQARRARTSPSAASRAGADQSAVAWPPAPWRTSH